MKAKRLCSLALPVFAFVNAASSGSSIANEFVTAHNRYRAKVGTPPVTWSDTLATKAQQWAATLIESGQFAHPRHAQFGQNLFEISGGHATPTSVVASWMSEEANYHHETNNCTAQCGHYTQIVWRSTKMIGCGVTRNQQREVWVCNYDPPGNIVGEKPY